MLYDPLCRRREITTHPGLGDKQALAPNILASSFGYE